jgi:hypothetical protein
VAHIGDTEVRSAVPGEVRSLEHRDGDRVTAGAPLADLGADKNHVWEALRGLYLVGQRSDLDDVERYTRPMAGVSDNLVRQATITAQAIRARAP